MQKWDLEDWSDKPDFIIVGEQMIFWFFHFARNGGKPKKIAVIVIVIIQHLKDSLKKKTNNKI